MINPSRMLFKFFSGLQKTYSKKPYGAFLWMGFNCLKATEPLQGGSLLFTTKFLEISATHLINLCFEHRTPGLGI